MWLKQVSQCDIYPYFLQWLLCSILLPFLSLKINTDWLTNTWLEKLYYRNLCKWSQWHLIKWLQLFVPQPERCAAGLSRFSCVWLCVWTVAHKVPLYMKFSRQECWNGLPHPPPEDLTNPGMELHLLGLLYYRQILYRWTTREACLNPVDNANYGQLLTLPTYEKQKDNGEQGFKSSNRLLPKKWLCNNKPCS